METEIIREEDLVLSWLSNSEGVKIIGRVFNNTSEDVYQGLLHAADKQEILFENTQDIIEHMKVRDNIDIEIDNELMTIKGLGRLNTKKTKLIEIFRISLTLIKMDMKEMISSVIRDCNVEGELSKQVVKKSIKTIAESLQKLLIQKEKKQTPFNFNIPQLSPHILQEFKQFKEEVHDLIDEYKKQNNQQKIRIFESINSFGQEVTDYLNQKIKKLYSNYDKTQEIQIIVKKIRCLGVDIQQLQNLIKYKKKDEISLNSIATEASMIDQQNEDKIKFHKIFKEIGNRIQYIGLDNKASHYIFNKEIPQDKQYKFKIKILRLPSPQIYIGVLDNSQQKKQYSFSLKKTWCYGANGRGFHFTKHSKQQSQGFKQGDLVQVLVDIPQHTIKWFINGVNHLSYFSIKNQISLMPFIMVWKTKTQVEWINGD